MSIMKVDYGDVGGGATETISFTNVSLGTTAVTAYDTEISTDDVLAVYMRSTGYSYDNFYKVENGVATFVDGLQSSYQYKYFSVDTSGSTLKVYQTFGSTAQSCNVHVVKRA